MKSKLMAINSTVGNKSRKKRFKLRKEKKANFSGWYTATSVTQSTSSIAEPYLPLFAQSLGASNSEIGLLAGLFSLINISQIVWAQLSLKFGNNKLFVFFGQLLTALLFIPLAMLRIGEFLILLGFRFFQGFFNSATIPSLATLKSDYISDQDRASKITKFTYLGLIGSFIGTMVGGLIFDYFNSDPSNPQSYSLIFLFSALVGIFGCSIFFFSVPNSTKTPVLQDTITPVSFINRDLTNNKSNIPFHQKFVNYLKKFKAFWLFTIFGVIFYFGVYTVSPFFIIIEINYFNFNFFQASLLTSVSIVAQVSISILLTKFNLMNVYGRKPYLLLGVFFIAFFTVLFAVPYYFLASFNANELFIYCFLIWIVLGTGWGLFNSTIAVLLLDIAHPQYRSLLIAVFNSSMGIVMFLGPVIGGFVIDATGNLFLPFIMRFIVLVVSFLFLLKTVHEPVISGIDLKPLKNVFPFIARMSAARGPEVGIAYGNEKLARKKHL